MKIVILCGGKGTRLREHTKRIPKPLVEIGGKPILWHIMKMYSYYGFKDFVLCLGYKGQMIKKYFMGHQEFKSKKGVKSAGRMKGWKITFADTGQETSTGGRIKRIQKYIKEDVFLATYGDGLSDIDLHKVIDFHKAKGKIATITCVTPKNPFGIVHIRNNGNVAGFQEKPFLSQWVNGGFFVFHRDVFKHVHDNDILEKHSFGRLIKHKELTAYKHKGFWKCMDTYKDTIDLEQFWSNGDAPWAKWLRRGKVK